MPGQGFAQGDDVGVEAEGAGDGVGQLPVPSIGTVDVNPLAVGGIDPAALLRFLILVVGFQQCGVALVPALQELGAALLHPALKVRQRNLVGVVEEGVVRSQDGDRRVLFADLLRPPGLGVRVGSVVVVVLRSLVLDNQDAAVLGVVEQAAIVGLDIRAHGVGAYPQDDGVVAR